MSKNTYILNKTINCIFRIKNITKYIKINKFKV